MSWISGYLKIPVEHRKFLSDDNDFNAPEYSDSVTIMCRKEGRRKYIISENQTSAVDVLVYITLEKIRVRDLLDGQVVLSVNTIYNFDGSISHYESTVGDS